jgi:hypothetical protein
MKEMTVLESWMFLFMLPVKSPGNKIMFVGERPRAALTAASMVTNGELIDPQLRVQSLSGDT